MSTASIAPLFAEKPEPTYFKPENLPGMHVLDNGIRLHAVGEEGDLLILGHHDDTTAIEALAAFQAWHVGETLSEGDRGLYDVERSFASFSDHNPDCELACCTCEEEACESCRRGAHTDCSAQGGISDEYCLCEDDYDHEIATGQSINASCGCECWCDEHLWWAFPTRVGHEVTWVRYSHARARARVEAIIR